MFKKSNSSSENEKILFLTNIFVLQVKCVQKLKTFCVTDSPQMKINGRKEDKK